MKFYKNIDNVSYGVCKEKPKYLDENWVEITQEQYEQEMLALEEKSEDTNE